jgi:hypothetical protein
MFRRLHSGAHRLGKPRPEPRVKEHRRPLLKPGWWQPPISHFWHSSSAMKTGECSVAYVLCAGILRGHAERAFLLRLSEAHSGRLSMAT